jgi:outer membrane protein assembly factor BamB
VSPLHLALPLAAALLAAEERPGPLQKEADAAPWTWKDEEASLFHSFQRYPGDYQVTLVKKPNSVGKLFVRFSKDGKTIHEFEGHYATVFAGKGNEVYYADFHPSASGCAVVAFDLATGKEVWKTHLKGLGPIAHTQYSNRVTLDLPRDDALRVYGNESAGKYVEYLDLRTGKTVGDKVFPRE